MPAQSATGVRLFGAGTQAGSEQPPGDAIRQRLLGGPVRLQALEEEFLPDLTGLYVFFQSMWKRKALALCWPADDPDLEMSAAVGGQTMDTSAGDLDGPWKISRFAFVQVVDDAVIVETPCVPVVTTILKPRAVALVGALCRPTTNEELVGRLPWIADVGPVEDLLAMLRNAGVISLCDAQGRSAEERDPVLQQWEFHDLLFHNRSRQGRHDYPMGAGFRFKDRLPAQPAVRPNRWRANAVALPRPDLERLAASDPPFTAILEQRRSVRAHDAFRPLSLQQLAEFLFRTARIRFRYPTEIGEFTSRPYPSGGASYEFELYVTANQCAGLPRGFYFYDPEAHALSLVQPANEDMEGLLDDAYVSAAGQCRPQVLITIASRFQRVSWKYSGIAYAAQLKNVGVLYQTFYLVATAMNLAGCALGLGNAARFGRLAGADYFQEGSIGEFMLGASA